MHLNNTFELSMVLDSEKFHKVLTRVCNNAEYLDENEDEYVDQSLASKGITIIYPDSQYKKKVKLIVHSNLVLDDDEPDPDKLTRKLAKCVNEYFGSKYGLDDFDLSGMLAGRLRNSDINRKKLKSMFEGAKGIIRAEVRLTKPKAIRACTNETNVSGQFAELLDKSKDIFLGTFTQVVPFGEFHKKEKAVEIIKREVKDMVLRRKMIQLVTLPVYLSRKFQNSKALNFMSNKNTYIRTLYSPEFSFLAISFFKTNLTLNFVPYLGKDNVGCSQYSKTEFLSTTVNYEGATALYLAAMPILDGNGSQMELVLPCSNNATLILECKPDPNNQMSTYLLINKNNRTIPFRFGTMQYRIKENGQMVTKIIQSGLGVFVKTLGAYLSGIGADLHLSKLSEEELNNQEIPSPIG